MKIAVPEAGIAVDARPGEPILAALARSGYSYRSGCRRGGCGICKVELVDGEVAYPQRVADTVLSDEEISAGTCLSCRAVPVTDVEIRPAPDARLQCIAPLLAACFQSC